MNDGGIKFGRPAAERIKRSVLKTERPEYTNGQNLAGPRVWTPGVMEAVVTTAITACVGTTYGKGNATIQIDSLSGSTFTAAANPAYAAGILVLNWYVNSGTIAIGTHITVYWYNGNFRLLTADC